MSEVNNEINTPVENEQLETTNIDGSVESKNTETNEVNAVEDNSNKNIKKRIDKLAAAKEEAIREANALRAELEAIRNKVSESTPVQNVQSDKPSLSDYENFEQYTEALTEWKLENKLREKETVQTQSKKQAAYASKVDEFVKEQPDFVLAVSEIQGVLSRDPAVVELIIESDVGPQLAYHLANHEEELSSLMKMTPAKRLAYLGKLEDRLETKAKLAKDKPATKASEPISRVTTKTSGSSSKSSAPPSDYNEWKKWRMANKR